jgi:hypothetical protein
LPRAEVIAEGKNWQRVGDEADTWLIRSSSKVGIAYEVNGRCTCSDYIFNHPPGGWCKHRIARALAKRASEILENENGAVGEEDTTAPDSMGTTMKSEDNCSTDPSERQVQRIDIVVGYEADEAPVLPHTDANGKLISFKADGRPAEPPTMSMSELYRWLPENGYVPSAFRWLDWEHGLRNRLQVYVLPESA